MKAVGILVPVGTCETSSQMLHILQIADLILLQSGTSVSKGVPIGETAATNKLKAKTFGRGGGDRKDKLLNKACALNALQPPPLSNWNKRNRRQVPLPSKQDTRFQTFRFSAVFSPLGALALLPPANGFLRVD